MPKRATARVRRPGRAGPKHVRQPAASGPQDARFRRTGHDRAAPTRYRDD